jgi:hypothetical protein
MLSDPVSGIFSAIPHLFSGVLFMLLDPVSGFICALSDPVPGVDPVSGFISARCLIRFLASSLCAV